MRKLFCVMAVLVGVSGITFAAPATAPASEPSSGLTISLAISDPQVPFGGDLKVTATLVNHTGEPIAIAPGALELKPDGWDAWGLGGTGLGNNIHLPAEDAKADLTVPAKGSATAAFTDREHTTVSLGHVRCLWKPLTQDAKLQALLGKPEQISVTFEVEPSQLMLSAWAAKSDEDRSKLLSAMKELLIKQTKREDSRQDRYIEKTFDYLAGAALPLLDLAARDDDPLVRAQAVKQYSRSAWSVGNTATILKQSAQPDFGHDADAAALILKWAKLVPQVDQKAADEACMRTALAGLKDKVAGVRIAAVWVLTWTRNGPLEEVKRLLADEDAGVRVAVQDYMTQFGGEAWAADALVSSLKDPSDEVRDKAIDALEHSPKPPPLAALKSGFAVAKGKTAIRLLAMLYEQEDKDLPATLLKGFADRSEEEKMAILASVAGHRDDATLDLAKLAMSDKSVPVQRQGLLRLLPFTQAKAGVSLAEYVKTCPPELKPLAQAVRKELQKREVFGFLASDSGMVAVAAEKEFPSKNGTVPMVSPDGKWVAYVETGWGQRGKGMGRSSMTSMVHVVGKDGKDDRIVSDMFLVAWMSDSRHVGSSRDGCAAVTDLEGNVAAEFGTKARSDTTRPAREWTKDGRMPHTKYVPDPELGPGRHSWNYAEYAAMSPDGKWLGPFGEDMAFLNASDETVTIPGLECSDGQAVWSPDGQRVLIWGYKSAAVVDFKTRKLTKIEPIDPFDPYTQFQDWDYRKCRWNPWSHDGSHVAFLRDGQVWVSKPDGQEARQVTWAARDKAFPTFSPDGKQVAYLCYQADNRRHYKRLGPTDLWVADLETGMETRVTGPDSTRIYCLDWLDRGTLIFDRLGEGRLYDNETSTLRVAHVKSQE